MLPLIIGLLWGLSGATLSPETAFVGFIGGYGIGLLHVISRKLDERDSHTHSDSDSDSHDDYGPIISA